MELFYEASYKIQHEKTKKFLAEPNRGDKIPYLDAKNKRTAEINFKLYRVQDMEGELNHPCLKEMSHLQNGDLVLLQNAEKTKYLVLLPKKDLFLKERGNVKVNRKEERK